MTEQELAAKVVEWLDDQHWDVYQEVQLFAAGNITDIVAVRDTIVMAVEVKKSLGLSVIHQAWRHLHRFHYSSVAAPVVKAGYSPSHARSFANTVCMSYGIGIIEIGGRVKQSLPPKLMRDNHGFAKNTISRLHNGHKCNAKAGSANGGHWTPYRNTMNLVKDIIYRHGECDLKTIMRELKEHHYCNDQSALGSIRHALAHFENWCGVRTEGRKCIYSIREARDED